MSYDVYVYGTTDLTPGHYTPSSGSFSSTDPTAPPRSATAGAPGDHTTHVGHGFAAGELQHDYAARHGSLSRAADLGHRL